MNYNNVFIETYKELENVIMSNTNFVRENSDGPVKWLEDNYLTDQEKISKLRICRLQRNFISHNEKEFITISETQITFLKNIINEIKNKTIESIAIPINKVPYVIDSQTDIETIIKKLKKFPQLIVIDKKQFIGVITEKCILEMMLNNVKLNSKLNSKFLLKNNTCKIVSNTFKTMNIEDHIYYLIKNTKGQIEYIYKN